MTLLLRSAEAHAREAVEQIDAEGLATDHLLALHAGAIRCAQALRQAVHDDVMPGLVAGHDRSLFTAVDAAYVAGADLLARAESLHSDTSSEEDLRSAMLALADLLAPAGWRRPKNAREATRRARRANHGGKAPGLDAEDHEDLVRLTIRAATHRVQSVLESGGAADVATERRMLRATAKLAAKDAAFAASAMTGEFSTPGQRRRFSADVERLSDAVDELAEWANAAHMGSAALRPLLRADDELRSRLGKATRRRLIAGQRFVGVESGEAVLGELLTASKDEDAEHETKDAALLAIANKLPGIFGSARDGVINADSVIGEPPPPKDPSGWEVLLGIAIDVALTSSAGFVGTASKRALEKYALGAADEVKDAFKDGVKQLYKSTVKATREAGRDEGASGGSEAGTAASASVAGRTARTQYIAAQQQALAMAEDRSIDHVANLWPSLAALDLDTLNEVSRALRGLTDNKEIADAQEIATITEWVNFKARWLHGAPEKGPSTRDADLTEEDTKQAFFAPAAVLDVRIEVDARLGEAPGVHAARVALPGLEPSVVDYFKNSDHTVGTLPFNKVVRFRPTGAVGWDDVAIVWKPDSGTFELQHASRSGKALLIAYALERPYDSPGFRVSDNAETAYLNRTYGDDMIHKGADKLMSAIDGMALETLQG